MPERKINLEEIIRESIIKYLTPKLQNPGQALGIANRIIEKEWYQKSAMLEFGKQLLELATENVRIYEDVQYDDCDNKFLIAKLDKQSILDTIKQVE